MCMNMYVCVPVCMCCVPRVPACLYFSIWKRVCMCVAWGGRGGRRVLGGLREVGRAGGSSAMLVTARSLLQEWGSGWLGEWGMPT